MARVGMGFLEFLGLMMLSLEALHRSLHAILEGGGILPPLEAAAAVEAVGAIFGLKIGRRRWRIGRL